MLWLSFILNMHTLKVPSGNVKMFAYTHRGRNHDALSHPPKIHVLLLQLVNVTLHGKGT